MDPVEAAAARARADVQRKQRQAASNPYALTAEQRAELEAQERQREVEVAKKVSSRIEICKSVQSYDKLLRTTPSCKAVILLLILAIERGQLQMRLVETCRLDCIKHSIQNVCYNP